MADLSIVPLLFSFCEFSGQGSLHGDCMASRCPLGPPCSDVPGPLADLSLKNVSWRRAHQPCAGPIITFNQRGRSPRTFRFTRPIFPGKSHRGDGLLCEPHRPANQSFFNQRPRGQTPPTSSPSSRFGLELCATCHHLIPADDYNPSATLDSKWYGVRFPGVRSPPAVRHNYTFTQTSLYLSPTDNAKGEDLYF